MSGLTDLYVVYRVLKLLSTPIEESDAFKLGIIDKDGKKIKNPSTSNEKAAYTILNRFVFKIQRALTKSQDKAGRKLLTYAAALAILRENDVSLLKLSDDEFKIKLDLYTMFEDVKLEANLLEHNVVSFKSFREDVAMSVGAGGIHGIGVGPKGEPGVDPRLMPMIRRKNRKKQQKWPPLNP